jgi:hypothetical protein
MRLIACGFGIAILQPSDNFDSFELVGFANGPVPGTQTVPRAEITAILATLMTTKGDVIYRCDNEQVAKTYNNGSRAQPTKNGLLWMAIHNARQERMQSGYGQMLVEWLPSHSTLTEAKRQGICLARWAANHIADAMAGAAAGTSAMRNAERAQGILDNNGQTGQVLKRLVAVALEIDPTANTRTVSIEAPRESKYQQVLTLASAAGHALNVYDIYVRCGLRQHNVMHHRAVFELKCLGKESFDFLGA